MSQMIYKRGGDTLVWGQQAHVKVIEVDELEAHLADGWVDHPSKLSASENAGENIAGAGSDDIDKGEISDGYHTFNELYAHRVRLFSTLMRAFADKAWWSFSGSDGEKWEGWILAGIATPEGDVTYHLPETEIPHLPEGTEIEVGKEWDGHTADDVLERLVSLNLPEPENKKRGRKPKAETNETEE
ncbi:TPA: hypothetical protein ACXNDR_001620 [Serratia marcescens]